MVKKNELNFTKEEIANFTEAERDLYRMATKPETVLILTPLYLDGEVLNKINSEAEANSESLDNWLNAYLRKILLLDKKDKVLESKKAS